MNEWTFDHGDNSEITVPLGILLIVHIAFSSVASSTGMFCWNCVYASVVPNKVFGCVMVIVGLVVSLVAVNGSIPDFPPVFVAFKVIILLPSGRFTDVNENSPDAVSDFWPAVIPFTDNTMFDNKDEDTFPEISTDVPDVK